MFIHSAFISCNFNDTTFYLHFLVFVFDRMVRIDGGERSTDFGDKKSFHWLRSSKFPDPGFQVQACQRGIKVPNVHRSADRVNGSDL